MKQVQEQQQNQTGREPEMLAGAWVGKFPNAGTLRAEVLAVLLASEGMAGMESVFAGAHRLSTVIRALTRRYGWPIERHEFAANTIDGRAAWVSMYCLPSETITRALELGAADWIEEVKAARYRRHQQAGKQQRLAGVLSPSMGDGRLSAS